MSLNAGARLGPYEILAPLGAGGMGEVYKARDTRLERMVAVKVLPERLSSSEEGRQRFEREARTISQLSHPHICALYDVGHQDGTDYLVMEYLEGETLADRLGKGALTLEQTLRYGVQIADALDKAHRQGIVHRDLKPGNVMLTKSGVKLLDFGLAKAIEAPAGQSGLTSFPTVAGSPALTQEGTILGTFQYMAPEQLEGKEADARTDIFAFGCVLYEIATGKKAFSGGSQASLISAIMSSEPPSLSILQPLSPPALDRVVATCLAKDPEDRWQSARDVARELQWIAGLDSSARAVLPAARPRRGRFAWAAAGIASAVALALAALLARRPPASAPGPSLRAALTPPDGSHFDLLSGPMAVSPDGTRVAFVGRAVGLCSSSVPSTLRSPRPCPGRRTLPTLSGLPTGARSVSPRATRSRSSPRRAVRLRSSRVSSARALRRGTRRGSSSFRAADSWVSRRSRYRIESRAKGRPLPKTSWGTPPLSFSRTDATTSISRGASTTSPTSWKARSGRASSARVSAS